VLRYCARAILLVCLYYPIYRYPLQIGDEIVSAGYRDTPLLLQAGKYALIGALTALLLCCALLRRVRLPNLPVLACILYVGLIPLLFLPVTAHPPTIESGVFWLAGAVLLACPIDSSFAVRALRFFAWFALAFVALQVALFITVGRLPAVSIDDSIAIRFGGPWDDPNGFAIALALLIPLGYLTHTGFARFVFTGCALLALLATQSLTGLSAFIVAVVSGAFVLLMLDVLRVRLTTILVLMPLGAFALLAAFAVLQYALNSGLIDAYLALKSGSIEGHLSGIDVLRSASLINFAGLEPLNRWGEMGYVNWLVNFGAPYSIVHLGLLVVMATSAALKARKSQGDERALATSTLMFLLAYMLALGNLPLDCVFPVNMLAIMLGTLVIRTPAESRLHHPRLPASHTTGMSRQTLASPPVSQRDYRPYSPYKPARRRLRY
jgi:hypothetical protein